MSAYATTILPSDRVNADLHLMRGYGVEPRKMYLDSQQYDSLVKEIEDYSGVKLSAEHELSCHGVELLRKVVH